MIPPFDYKTIAEKSTGETITEKGSRFISFVFPVESEQEIKIFLAEIKELHPKATHHCYAYRLGFSGENYRANDDGEPSGTAGLPIYNQLLAFEVTNILLIVVRYYGGTKLGVSGLIKAYKNSAKDALENSEIILKKITFGMEISFPFHLQNKIFSITNRNHLKILDFSAENTCILKTEILAENKENFLKIFEEIPEVEISMNDRG